MSESDEDESAAGGHAAAQQLAHNRAVVTALSSQMLASEAAHQSAGRFLLTAGTNARILLLLAAVHACASGCGRCLSSRDPIRQPLSFAPIDLALPPCMTTRHQVSERRFAPLEPKSTHHYLLKPAVLLGLLRTDPLPSAGSDPDLVTSLLPSLLQLARSGADNRHASDATQPDLGLEDGLPTAALCDRLATDASAVANDLLLEAMLRVVAVGDASVLPPVRSLIMLCPVLVDSRRTRYGSMPCCSWSHFTVGDWL